MYTTVKPRRSGLAGRYPHIYKETSSYHKKKYLFSPHPYSRLSGAPPPPPHHFPRWRVWCGGCGGVWYLSMDKFIHGRKAPPRFLSLVGFCSCTIPYCRIVTRTFLVSFLPLSSARRTGVTGVVGGCPGHIKESATVTCAYMAGGPLFR